MMETISWSPECTRNLDQGVYYIHNHIRLCVDCMFSSYFRRQEHLFEKKVYFYIIFNLSSKMDWGTCSVPCRVLGTGDTAEKIRCGSALTDRTFWHGEEGNAQIDN